MLRSYLLTAIRNLLKNKLNAFINVIGLAVAFTCSILLFLMVQYEFSFDRFQAKGDRLYQVYNLAHEEKGDSKGDVLSYPAAAAFKAEVPGVLRATAILPAGNDVSYMGKETVERITVVDTDFFSMFGFSVLAGNSAAPLGSVNSVVLSRSAATAIFGKADPLGKTIKVKIGGVWSDVVVSTVLQDPPTNSTIQYAVLARVELMPDYANNKNNWSSHDSDLVFGGRLSRGVGVEVSDGGSLKRKGFREAVEYVTEWVDHHTIHYLRGADLRHPGH